MTVEIAIKFQNQIYAPTLGLLNELIAHPLVMDPDSNSLLHRFEGLCLHAHHFEERNKVPVKNNQKLEDIANSIKHIRSRGRQVTLESFGAWEFKHGLFRFISHGIEARWEDGATTDAIECLLGRVNALNRKIQANLPDLKVGESVYGFYDWAFAYHLPLVSVATLSHRIRIMERTETGNYRSFAPPNVRFVVLAGDLIGTRPEDHFPEIR
ncbi:hypothetical protein ACIQUB_19605 [Rhizobium sp. NPDC090275]|uniref:hypothetical protein n=1 Tax=Rhizobium sp. NPDC090275 TaxID=3364498 RepID=UPI00383B631C